MKDTLTYLDGAVPTPHGQSELHGGAKKDGWELAIVAPVAIRLLLRCPPGYVCLDQKDGTALEPVDRRILTRRYVVHLTPK